ncbi:hypothetical protein CCACVL1_02423 [Corchorus capsularis]|uniref:Uncharacterized protein n=1 Tax=Corchorus capsularis TaxID=210143 RepID=A0A1R3K8L9_COCAP|nr:hypothetical protein CCACVL1_02423 [Corchorus capsularis]
MEEKSSQWDKPVTSVDGGDDHKKVFTSHFVLMSLSDFETIVAVVYLGELSDGCQNKIEVSRPLRFDDDEKTYDFRFHCEEECKSTQQSIAEVGLPALTNVLL